MAAEVNRKSLPLVPGFRPRPSSLCTGRRGALGDKEAPVHAAAVKLEPTKFSLVGIELCEMWIQPQLVACFKI
ncbi:Hypothetical predicted protein [Podarcis lilfordi]|uniref:Uncharacterized protein n=1 Tax=Podarcis lilfordi TaxID=74358 RepID=A0AA35LAE0_9SAUR|nr:Hypothetical predicted protein [Podarcis lilfordi]